MITQEKIERQRVLVSALKTKMQNYDTDPEQWAAQRGYIPTCVYLNRPGAGAWTEGIHFVVLDEHHIVFRTGGDSRDDGEWEIVDPATFVDLVVTDAEEFLARWEEEASETEVLQ